MGTRKTATTTFQNLSLGIKEVRSLVSLASDQPDLLCSRSRVLKALASATNKLDSVIQDRSKRELLPTRRAAKRVNNILISLSNGVEHDHIDPDEMLETISTSLSDEIEALATISESSDQDDDIDAGVDLDGTLLGESSNEIEMGDMKPTPVTGKRPVVRKEDYTRTVQSLNKYEKSKEKLTSKLRRSNSVEPVELPLAVNFSTGRLQSPDALSAVFPGQVDLVGVNGARSRDIGVVLRDQIVLQFSKSAAEEYAQEVANNSAASVQYERAKQLVKPLRSSLAKIQKSLEHTVAEIEKLSEYETPKPKFKFKGRAAPKDDSINKVLAELRSEEAAQRERLASIKEKLTQQEDRLRTATSLRNSVKKTTTEPTQAMVELITEFLNNLAEQGRHYVLMSTRFVPSPKNSDIMLAWVVNVHEHRKLSNLSGGNAPSVSMWGPAWSSSKVVRSKKMPKSMFLTTKVK